MRTSSRLLLLILLLSAGKAAFATESLSLWEAMERAARFNPAIKSQQGEIDRQTLEQDVARSQHLPTIDLRADYTHHAYPNLVTPIREAGVFPPLDRDIASIGLALSLPLYSGGKLVAGEALAAHDREVSVQALRAGGQDLMFNVVATYTKALHFRQMGKVLNARIVALQQEERDIGLRIQQGRAAPLELIRLQRQLSQARYDKVSVNKGERNALALLAALLGDSGALPVLPELEATAPQPALDRSLQQHPDLLRLEAMDKAAQQKTAIALEQASFEERQNTLQQEDTGNRIASEVGQVFGALSEARARLELATQSESAASEVLRIETLRYHSGENTITDLLGAESTLWSATASRLQAGYDITVSEARLLRAIGELGPGSFKPADAGEKTGAGDSSPGIEVHRLAQYLAWHRCGMVCGGEAASLNVNAGVPDRQELTPAKLARESTQQGARL